MAYKNGGPNNTNNHSWHKNPNWQKDYIIAKVFELVSNHRKYTMKYMGSKSRFSKDIIATIESVCLHKKPKKYIEPFAGGMNMVCEIKDQFGKKYANDQNVYLIAMWKALQKGWVPPKKFSKEFYKKCKSGNCEDHVRGYVGFCSYAGKWFGGYAGITKTQQGIRDYQKEAYQNISKQTDKILDVTFFAKDYSNLVIPKNSVVYCDPPYADTSGYGVKFDHDVFWDWVRETAKDNFVFVSEYNAPPDFSCIWKKSSSSTFGNKSTKYGIERLFVLTSELIKLLESKNENSKFYRKKQNDSKRIYRVSRTRYTRKKSRRSRLR